MNGGGVASPATVAGHDLSSLPDLILPIEDAIYDGKKVCIWAPTHAGKTTVLRRLGRDGKKVLYINTHGNPSAIQNLRKIVRGGQVVEDWTDNWTIRTPTTFLEACRVAKSATSKEDPHDIIIHDHGTQLFKMYTSAWLNQSSDKAGFYQVFLNDPKLKRPGQFDWVDLGHGFLTFLQQSLELAATAYGSKTVIWIFQAGKDKDDKPGPAIIPSITAAIPNMFDMTFFVGKFQKAGDDRPRRWILTDADDRYCGHRFSLETEESGMASVLDQLEPPDLQGILEKLARFGF